MKAVQIQNIGQAEVVEIPVPQLAAGEVLVEVKAVTTCPQWDLHILQGKPMLPQHPPIKYPYVAGRPGHEMSGTVVEVSEGSLLRPGQSVCAWRDEGQSRPGCYAEYVAMKEANLILVPEQLPYQKVVSLELAMCVAVSVLKLKRMTGISGKRCAVNGLGPAGLIALQMLLAEGADSVIGLDLNPDRRALAERLGAASAIDPRDGTLPLRKQPGAPDLTLDCVGYAEAIHYMMEHTKEAIALFAVQREDYVLRPHLRTLDILNYSGHHYEAAEYALELIVAGKLDMSPLITHEMPFEQYTDGVELLRKQEAIKICFIPQRKR